MYERAEMSFHNTSRDAVQQHIDLMSTWTVASTFQNLECGLLDNTVVWHVLTNAFGKPAAPIFRAKTEAVSYSTT
jgi:hypothetical protein